MKKIISLIMCLMLMFSSLTVCPLAVSVESGKQELDDGSYIFVSFVKPDPDCEDGWVDIDHTESQETEGSWFFNKIIKWFRDLINRLFAKQSTVTKTKYCSYFDSDGKLLWTVSLKGTFIYNHRQALCVSSEISYEIRDKDWKMLSYQSSETDNTASGDFTIRQYKLGVPLKLISRNIILRCDKNGDIT